MMTNVYTLTYNSRQGKWKTYLYTYVYVYVIIYKTSCMSNLLYQLHYTYYYLTNFVNNIHKIIQIPYSYTCIMYKSIYQYRNSL